MTAHDDLAGVIQHTEVSATADRDRIEAVLEECTAHGFDGAMVQPCWVPLAAERLAGTAHGGTDGRRLFESVLAVAAA
jgi:deoxyribose-phosphate aldolase